MAMRLSGLMSGMDTDSVIKELVSAKQKKVDTAKKAQTKLEWKQDVWKDLNTKLKNLQSKYLSNMRFVSSYSKKTTKVSNGSAVSVITGENAVNGVQSLTVDKLAKTAYLTGGKLADAPEGKQWTALSKISDIVGDGFTGGSINVTAGGNAVEITVDENTTISDFLTKIKNVGLNASFDANNQRFFISAKESGTASNFSITASDAGGMSVLSGLGLQVGLDKDTTSLNKYKEYAGYYVEGDNAATIANMRDLIDKDVQSQVDKYLSQYRSAQSAIKTANDKIKEIEEKYADKTLESSDYYKEQLEPKEKELEELNKKIYITPNGAEKAELVRQKHALEDEIKEIKNLKQDADSLAEAKKSVETNTEKIADVEKYITVSETTDEEGNPVYSAVAKDDIVKATEESYLEKAKYAAKVVADYEKGIVLGSGATKIEGQDAVITLNGATFTSSTNSFEINGLTFTALSETAAGEEVTITTQDDTDGIYDMIKNFIKEYNSVINEMDKLYNAESANGYEPLTDEEKDALSDSEVEKYEKKIKDALLRRDENLSKTSQGLKEIMLSTITVGDKKLSLADFGIETLGYFEAADNEKNMFHIAGDPDDEYKANSADKLKSLISSDPNTVIEFFSTLSKNLYSKMSDLSKSADGVRSFGSFYDDKKMKSDYLSYNSKIADLEKKLQDYEDKWYSKFSKMETAMAKMQSNTSAVTAMLGGQ